MQQVWAEVLLAADPLRGGLHQDSPFVRHQRSLGRRATGRGVRGCLLSDIYRFPVWNVVPALECCDSGHRHSPERGIETDPVF